MSVEENKWKCLGLDSQPFLKQSGAPLSRVSSVDLVQEDLREFLADIDPKIAVITGPRGVGKTRVTLDFINNIDNRHIRYVAANRGLGVNTVLKLIADIAGIEEVGEGLSPEIAVHRVVEAIKSSQSKFVMIIDNASELPIQALSLITMVLAKLPLELYCKFIVMGQPIMFDRVTKLAYADSYQFDIKHIHMKPFTYLETQQYIYDNLYACGWQGQPNKINESVIKQIYNLSHGVARQINYIASDELLRALSTDQEKITQVNTSGKKFKKASVAVAGLLALGSTLYATNLFSHRNNNAEQIKPAQSLSSHTSDAVTTQNAEQENTEVTLVIDQSKPIDAFAFKQNRDDEQANPDTTEQTLDTSEQEHLLTADTISTPHAGFNILADQKSSSLTEEPMPQSENVVDDASTPDITFDNATIQTEQPSIVACSSSPVSNKVVHSCSIHDQDESDEDPSETNAIQQDKQAHIEDQISEGAWTSVNIQDKLEMDRAYLKSADGYVIQMAALDHIEDMAKFLNSKHITSQQIRIYRGVRAGIMKYIAVLNAYTNLADARSAMKSLPEQLAKVHPWVRTSASLRKDMQEVDTVLSL